MQKGIVMNIQKYSVHDGPGIRTTVFFNGCPLSCLWCHNPESQSLMPDLIFLKNRCTGCGVCMSKCVNNAITIENGYPVTDRNKCLKCGKCALFCPHGAREICGEEMSVTEVMKEILKDSIFYEESNGGVTFSGGECFMQHDFLKELLVKCREKGIHTAVDTSGYVSENIIKDLAEYIDLFLYDLKAVDNEIHRDFTGVSNEVIIRNLKMLSEMGKDIFIRIPVIPGFNEYDENWNRTVEILKTVKVIKVSLLPYNNFAESKYNRIEKKYQMSENTVPSDERMERIKNIFDTAGIKAEIGG